MVRCKEDDDAEDGWDAQGIETRDSERGLRKVSHHEDRYRKAVELEKDLGVLLRCENGEWRREIRQSVEAGKKLAIDMGVLLTHFSRFFMEYSQDGRHSFLLKA